MATVNCPNCDVPMERKADPDVTTDVCARCGGMFLDAGELNELATGMAGDIEFCSVDSDAHEDKFPVRTCPKCQGEQMRKVNLLAFSEIIMDYCPGCHGFFLDRGEMEAINAELKGMSKAEDGGEFRGYRDEHLVRVGRRRDVYGYTGPMGLMKASSVGVDCVSAVVYFEKPLGLNLRVSEERWTTKLAHVFALFGSSDITTGDASFDDAFVVHGDDEIKVRDALNTEAREALLNFRAGTTRILSEQGKIEVLDDRVVYTEGPYRGTIKADVVAEADEVVQNLLDIVRKLETH